MSIVKTGQEGFSGAIDNFSTWSCEIVQLLFPTDENDFVAFDRNKIRFGLFRVDGDDISIFENQISVWQWHESLLLTT